MSTQNIAAPTVNNTGNVSVTVTASAEQVLPVNARMVTFFPGSAAFVNFGAPGSVAAPSATVGFKLTATSVPQRFELFHGATSFRVIRDTADSVLYWVFE